MPLYTTDATLTRHWVLPFASSLSDPCQNALPHLEHKAHLPHLRELLSTLSITQKNEGDEYALTLPHEKLLAGAMQWPDAADGCQPWAAWYAAQDGLQLDAQQPWGLLSPCHLLMGRDHFTLLAPQALALAEAESKTLLEAIRPLFEEDGWTLAWGSTLRWYASHPTLKDVPTATLERVIGRNPDIWLASHDQARMIRRLQSEVQMLLYQHPLHDERLQAGQLSVNSFWLSGCGLPPAQCTLPDHIVLLEQLSQPLLSDDMPAWVQAWEQLDATVLKSICEAVRRQEPVALTLCGDRHAVTYATTTQGIGQRFAQKLRQWTGLSHKPSVMAALQDL